MDCKDVSAQLLDLINGELADEERRAIEEHLAGCARCRQELTTLRGCWDALCEDEAVAVGPEFRQRIWRRVDRPRRWRWIAAAAAMLAVALGGALYYVAPNGGQNGLEQQLVREIEEPQDVDVISNLDVLPDLDVIQALSRQGENGKNSS